MVELGRSVADFGGSASGVAPPLEGVGNILGSGGGGAGFFGGYRLSISALTAFSVLNPLPSRTTLIFSLPDRPILCPSHAFIA